MKLGFASSVASQATCGRRVLEGVGAVCTEYTELGTCLLGSSLVCIASRAARAGPQLWHASAAEGGGEEQGTACSPVWPAPFSQL